MAGEIALDSSVAIRYLNGEPKAVKAVASLPTVALPLVVVGELPFGAENSTRSLENLTKYLEFINACATPDMGRATARVYSRTRCALKRKARPIPENDLWIAAQCLEQGWSLATDDGHFAAVEGLTVVRW
jgi:tRNA(fMet)-specific endonuclease VapC